MSRNPVVNVMNDCLDTRFILKHIWKYSHTHLRAKLLFQLDLDLPMFVVDEWLE